MVTKLYAVTARVLCASLCVLATSPVLAQAEQTTAEPAPEASRWMALVLAIFMFGAVCLGCFMTPKRTHQD